MRSNQERKFVDFSKSEEGKKIFEKNKSLWTNGDFFTHIRSLKDPNEIELAQIMRKYQSSFSWIQYIKLNFSCYKLDKGKKLIILKLFK